MRLAPSRKGGLHGAVMQGLRTERMNNRAWIVRISFYAIHKQEMLSVWQRGEKMKNILNRVRRVFSGSQSKKEKPPAPRKTPILPDDPFAERVDMDIAFRNDLHELLYTRIRKGNVPVTEFIWSEFLKKYPEFERFRSDWKTSRKRGVTPISHGLPWMNYAAIEFLENYLQPSFKVFEWGMGGSTIYWSARAAEVVSVEHDAQWFDTAQEALGDADETVAKRSMILHEPSAEATKVFTSGDKKYDGMSFEAYSRAIEEFPEGYFDLIVVDGRARMACLHNCMKQLSKTGVILLDNSDYARYQTELNRFWQAHQEDFERTDFLSPTPFSSNIGSQTTVFMRQS